MHGSIVSQCYKMKRTNAHLYSKVHSQQFAVCLFTFFFFFFWGGGGGGGGGGGYNSIINY